MSAKRVKSLLFGSVKEKDPYRVYHRNHRASKNRIPKSKLFKRKLKTLRQKERDEKWSSKVINLTIQDFNSNQERKLATWKSNLNE